MINNIDEILDKLKLEKTGHYKDHFYIIDLENSADYARTYSKLDELAVNTEYPNFGSAKNGSVSKITNYFEVEIKGTTYLLFLIADFSTGKYYLKIGE